MRDRFVISEVGLRLIKTYEGFRPVDMELITGQSVAGYGHRVQNGQSMSLSKAQAEALLLEDLAPYEAMINDHVFAPLTQSQFDALCSLAFNIGPKKFLHSDTLRALNNGRVLDAAYGFDVWRRANINGESYVVDALVRRRTAEKVLFLRPQTFAALAPRAELNAVEDAHMAGLSTAAPEPIFEQSGLVGRVNYNEASQAEAPWQEGAAAQGEAAFIDRRSPETAAALQPTPMRRKDDHPGGVLTLSEVHYDDEFSEEFEDEFADAATEIERGDTGPSDIGNSDTGTGDTGTGDFEDCDIIEDIKGFVRDIEEGNDINKSDNYEAIDYDDVINVESGALEAAPAAAVETDDFAFDPDRDISSRAAALSQSASLDMDAPLELTQLETEPSPIASAAAEVSGRLDALMGDNGIDRPEVEGKVLPFSPRKSIAPEDIISKVIKDETETGKAARKSVASASQGHSSKQLYAGLLAQDSDEGTDIDSGSDSASRYIEHNIASVPGRASALPLSIMVVLGMVLLGGSLGAMASGFDERFDAIGKLLFSIGLVMGIMITLGSIYYIIKNSRKAA